MTHFVDIHVGKRIRRQRWINGTTQQQLAEAVGVKFQQIQKYESGMNRVSSSRLWDIANAVSVPVTFFFEGLEPDTHIQRHTGDILANKESIDLLQSYYALPKNQRQRLFDLARALSEAA